MSLPSTRSYDDAVDRRQARGYGGHFYGVYPATVVSITDPADQGRVRVELPWTPDTGDSRYEAWARLATMMAGATPRSDCPRCRARRGRGWPP